MHREKANLTLNECLHTSMLVVEDEQATRRLMLAMLENHGFRAQGVGSAEEAWDVLRHPGQDVPRWLVVDHDLPGMCGLDLIRRVLDAHPAVQPMLVTATEPDKVQDFCTENAVAYFPKPLDIQQFINHLHSQTYRPPSNN